MLGALRSARREAGKGGGAGADPTLLLLLTPPPGRGLGWRIPARTASRQRAGAHRPAAARPTRGNTWLRGGEVGLRGFLLYLVNSFLLEQLLQNQPRRLEKMARCVFKQQPFAGGFEVNSGDARLLFCLQEQEWLFSSRMEVRSCLSPPTKTNI
ncbi:unnamed protein product [Coccothraustes coccothraustes]